MKRCALVGLLLCASVPVGAVTFSFGGKTFAPGATANGGDLPIGVCLAPSMSASQAAASERSLRNAVERWNRRQPTTANLRSNVLARGKLDFESVAMHELGHCLGLDHPNLGSRVGGASQNATQADPGANGRFDVDAGADGIVGSEDDLRGDDKNLFHFRALLANPFSIDERVDDSTWTKDLARLPAGSGFPSNPEREVGPLYGAPFTEAVMQHDIFVRELARDLSHDDVAGVRLGMAGFDGQQGTGDDYRPQLEYLGREQSGCRITVEYDANKTGFAQCSASARVLGGNPSTFALDTGVVTFNPGIDWYYNTSAPCSATQSLTAGAWHTFSSPCTLGVSSVGTVRAQLADDLGEAGFGTRWTVYDYRYSDDGGAATAGYVQLDLDDSLEAGRGYWLLTLDTGRTIDLVGEYSARVDAPLRTATASGAGWNLLGYPFRFAAPFAEAQVIAEDGAALTLAEADPALGGTAAFGNTACTAASRDPACLVARYGFVWRPIDEAYERIDDRQGQLQPFDAVWVFAADDAIELRLPMPTTERTTP